MKKLFVLLFIAAGLTVGNAKAQCLATVTVDYTFYGSNLQNTFDYYVTCDGYLHYSLVDNGAGGEDYESFVYIFSGEDNFTPVDVYHWGGGSICGSVFIGVFNQDLTIIEGAGTITGDHIYEPDGWEISVSY